MRITSQKLLLKMLVSSLLVALPLAALPVIAQSEQDIVIIGDTADQRQHFQSYWQQLLNLNQTTEQTRPKPQPQQPDVQKVKLQKILRNLYVRDLGLDYIIQLNGSSQLSGVLTNENDVPVTVLAVNYEIVDHQGYLLQTGSAQPEPSTIAPGQSVTFSDTLWTIPPDARYKVQLLDPPFEIGPDFQ